jgi:hypothetical protein
MKKRDRFGTKECMMYGRSALVVLLLILLATAATAQSREGKSNLRTTLSPQSRDAKDRHLASTPGEFLGQAAGQ